MKRSAWTATAVAILLARAASLQPLLAQSAPGPAPALDENGKPIPRAIPVIPRAQPVEKPKPALRAGRPVDIIPPAEMEEPGSIRIGPGAGVKSPDQVQIDIADNFYSQKKYEQAAPEYERYLGVYPTGPARPQALFRLGESYRHNGAFNAARNAYETLLRQFPENDFVGPAAYRLADIFYQEKQYRDAVNLYRKASVRLKDPTLMNSAKFFAARSLELMDDKPEARLAYEDLLTASENNPFRDASRFSLALLLKDSGRLSEALKQMQTAAKQAENPELKVEATVKAAQWEIESGSPQNLAAAAADFKSALAMPGASAWKQIAQLGLLHIAFDSGKFQAVIDGCEKAIPQAPADLKPEFIMLAGKACHQLGKSSEALKYYDQILKEFPNSDFAKDARYQRLRVMYAANEADLPAEIDKYLAANPDASNRDEALLMKAEIYFKKQEYEKAAPLYSELELSRQLTGNRKGDALFRLAWCQMELHDLDHAIKSFTSFIDGYPGNKMMQYALIQRGIAYQSQKNMASALKDFDALIREYPKSKDREVALHQKALILGQQDDSAGMAETFRQLLKEYPDTADKAQADYWIGWADYGAKNYKEAVPYLEEARKLDEGQFWEKASIRLLSAQFALEDKAATAREVDLYSEKGKVPVPPEILRWLGGEFNKSADYQKAEKYLKMLTSRDEATPDDFFLLGRVEHALGGYQAAVDALKSYLKSVKLPRQRAEGLLTLAESQIALKALDEAQTSDDEALSLQPEGEINGRARIVAGDIQMARNNFAEAAKLYESVAVILDNNEITPAALQKAVNAWKAAGDEARSKKTLNTLKSRYPEYQEQKQATAAAAH